MNAEFPEGKLHFSGSLLGTRYKICGDLEEVPGSEGSHQASSAPI